MAKATPAKKAPATKAPARRRVVDEEDDPVVKAPEAAKEPEPVKANPVPAITAAPPPATVDTPEAALKEAAERVIVNVPNAFRLRLTSHRVIAYPKGAYAMDKEHAEHWFAKASGVTIVEG